jgi:hypothetical protein
MMLVLLVPPLPGGSGTFSIATWNIRSSQGAGLMVAAKGLCHLGVGCAVLTETKPTNERYPKLVLGYWVISLKAVSPQQGGVALLWRAEHRDFEVEAVNIASPNILTFQLVMGEDQFFVLGAYIPPADTTGVDDLCAPWAKCPGNCKPLLLGDLNIVFRAPQTKWEEIIVDLLNEINLVDMSRKFVQQRGRQQGRGARWTWRQQRGGQWHQSQPDYCMALDRDTKLFWNVAFQQPRIHDSDHRAVVASISRGRPGQLKRYCRRRQTFPLQLPSVEEQDEQTRPFVELRKSCTEDALTQRKQNNWISEESWRLITHRAMLRRTDCLCQTGGHCLYRQIGVLLCKDRAKHTKGVGTQIESELTGGECVGGLLPP